MASSNSDSPAGAGSSTRDQVPSSGSWSPDSWKTKNAAQQPTYSGDPGRLHSVVEQLSSLPPLVTSWEIESLKEQLADAALGHNFLLQGGDCAESFADCQPTFIANKLKILLQMSLVLVHASRKRVIRVGRMAGQYAKPRSADVETKGEVSLPSYRGDLVNQPGFDADSREPDPELLLRGYERAALTLNFTRALVDHGFADLHHPEYWDVSFVDHSPRATEYQQIVQSIGESVRFMETLAGDRMHEINRVDFFTSHEGLHLLYEQACTRQVPHREGWYNLSTHMPWIGMRTANLDGAHVEYFRGIRNPIGVKIGAATSPDDLLRLIDTLDPDAEPGRLTLIHRFGKDGLRAHLPPLLEAVKKEGRTLLWCCDPMHGNTITTQDGVKTRHFESILSELEQAFEVHEQCGSRLGGVHFELTGEDVTECIGGARGLGESDLGRAYHTQVDPRLNYEQALEMAMLIARRTGE